LESNVDSEPGAFAEIVHADRIVLISSSRWFTLAEHIEELMTVNPRAKVETRQPWDPLFDADWPSEVATLGRGEKRLKINCEIAAEMIWAAARAVCGIPTDGRRLRTPSLPDLHVLAGLHASKTPIFPVGSGGWGHTNGPRFASHAIANFVARWDHCALRQRADGGLVLTPEWQRFAQALSPGIAELDLPGRLDRWREQPSDCAAEVEEVLGEAIRLQRAHVSCLPDVTMRPVPAEVGS
jgi:hypothetical protein